MASKSTPKRKSKPRKMPKRIPAWVPKPPPGAAVEEGGFWWRFRKGQSGNPGGHPASIRPVIELARNLSIPALHVLAEIAANPKAPAVARIAAADKILDRAWGKPHASVSLSGPDGGPVPLEFTALAALRDKLLRNAPPPPAEVNVTPGAPAAPPTDAPPGESKEE